ncbi:heat shock-related 70 kDa protein 2 [Platysternon megacephalum]|uniref:Heat shock-related 70 kDa protein 2 n=1 Tax=Platysternon megacephalum TaxID=55544 RepID=A0A4D9F321_9SAUR|nr:heat shock-related 70 kDa protein 2 [Platysternon megacephalum]
MLQGRIIINYDYCFKFCFNVRLYLSKVVLMINGICSPKCHPLTAVKVSLTQWNFSCQVTTLHVRGQIIVTDGHLLCLPKVQNNSDHKLPSLYSVRDCLTNCRENILSELSLLCLLRVSCLLCLLFGLLALWAGTVFLCVSCIAELY